MLLFIMTCHWSILLLFLIVPSLLSQTLCYRNKTFKAICHYGNAMYMYTAFKGNSETVMSKLHRKSLLSAVLLYKIPFIDDRNANIDTFVFQN